MKNRFRALAFVFFLVAGDVVAGDTARAETAPLDDARTLFSAGHWLEAIEMAEAEGIGEGLALATQITCYYGRFLAPEDERKALFARAMEIADAAIALAPESAGPHLQSAHAMGRYSQELGLVEAMSEGFAGRIRDAVDKALEIDPDNAGAHLLLANWHAQILASAGLMGSMIYGADEEEALAHYSRAVTLAPDAALIRVEYAAGLLLLDEDDNQDAARAQLQAASAQEPETAFGKLIRQRAITMLAALDQPGE